MQQNMSLTLQDDIVYFILNIYIFSREDNKKIIFDKPSFTRQILQAPVIF